MKTLTTHLAGLLAGATLCVASASAQAQQGLLAILPIGGGAPSLSALDPVIMPLTDAGVLPRGLTNRDRD